MKHLSQSIDAPNRIPLWARLMLAATAGLVSVACATPVRADQILGCYAFEENGKAILDFHSKDGVIQWAVRRRSGWARQPDTPVLHHEGNRHPEYSSETFDKMEAMLDLADMDALIKFKKDRIQEIKGGGGYEKAIEHFKKANTPYLFRFNGTADPVYRVPCDK